MRTWLPVWVLTVLVLAAGCGTGVAPATKEDPGGPVVPSSAPVPTARPNAEPTRSAPASESRPPTVRPRPAPAERAKLNRALIAAAWENDLRRARTLIKSGADVNAQDGSGQSAYLISTSEGFLELLELTLEHGADVDAKDSFNGTGLIRAADRGHADIEGRLVQAGVQVDHVNRLGWTALHEAILLGDGSARYVATVRVLVAAGADVELRSRRDRVAPLAHARAKGFDRITAVLRATLGADRPSRRSAERRLIAAAERGDATRVSLALRARAGLETRDDRGRSPLLVAVILGDGSRRYQEVVSLLLAAGADRRLPDRHGETAREHAERRGHRAIAAQLRT